MLKTLISSLILIGASSAFAASPFDPAKEIGCSVAVGSYDEVQKLVLGPAGASGFRDVNAFKVGKFESACSLNGDQIVCDFQARGLVGYKYRLVIDGRGYQSGGAVVADGSIRKSLSAPADVVCRQY